MPPGLRLRPRIGRSHMQPLCSRMSKQPACLFCSFHLAKPRPGPGNRQIPLRRATYSTAPVVTTTTTTTPAQARAELQTTLTSLQNHAGPLVNLSRLQLAIRALQQPAGRESIRVAVLGLKKNIEEGKGGGASAKELLRLLLADPLKPREPWENQLISHDVARPLIVRVRGNAASTSGVAPHRLAKEGELDEIEVSSAAFNGHNIEFLVMESTLALPTAAPGFEGESENFEETALVPTVEIPVSDDGRFTPVTTPVHQALIVTDGISGAAAVGAMPLVENKDEILAAVNLKNVHKDDIDGCAFVPFDATSSSCAIDLFRESVTNAKAYEDLWLHGGLPSIIGWIKAGALTRTDGTTKPAVRALIASLLKNALASIQDLEAKQLSKAAAAATTKSASTLPARTFQSLNTGLAEWAETAHAELQEQLDLAFSGQRWRRLGWWKLFYRADDVTFISSSLLAQRFLPKSEQEAVYLAGRIEEAARVSRGNIDHRGSLALYSEPTVAMPPTVVAGTSQEAVTNKKEPTPSASTAVVLATSKTKWPTNISFTRNYLLNETVPALQALADKLVLQTASSAGLTTALAALTYLSSIGAYEAGAIFALGLIWSLRRMQKQWETARQFWEGEVREEGRKAVRVVEKSVAETLDRTREVASGAEESGHILHDLREARELVAKAEEALAKLK